jgi:hypothetical protein
MSTALTAGWYRIPETIDQTGADAVRRPDYVKEIGGIAGYAGFRGAVSPQWVAWVRGSETALADLASQSDVSELSTSQAQSHATDAASVTTDDVAQSYQRG